MITAKAIFVFPFSRWRKNIIIQCGGDWAKSYFNPIEAADQYWEYLDQSQYIKDVARYWDGFKSGIVWPSHCLIFDIKSLLNLDKLVVHHDKTVRCFFERIQQNKIRDDETLRGGWISADNIFPNFLYRWFDNEEDAQNDPSVINGTRHVVKC